MKNILTKLARIILAFTPHCNEMARLASESLDQTLPFHVRVKMRLHHLLCAWCTRYHRQLQYIHKLLHSHPEKLAPPETLSPSAKERIRETLRNSS